MGKNRGGKKASKVKLANKHQYKLGKQGKLKQLKSRIKKRTKAQLIRRKIEEDHNKVAAQARAKEEEEEEEQLAESEEDINEDDLSFFTGADTSFASSMLNKDERKNRRKRKNADDTEDNDDLETAYEQQKADGPSEKKMKLALPLRYKEQVITQMVEDEEKEDQEDNVQKKKKNKKQTQGLGNDESSVSLSVEDLIVKNRKGLLQIKLRVASLASSVVENPLENHRKLRDLRALLEETGISLAAGKVVLLSLTEVFLDILPSYRIRNPTDQEKQTQQKAETKKLRDYEAALLNNYRSFLLILEAIVKDKSKQSSKQQASSNKIWGDLQGSQRKGLVRLATQCFCRLFSTHLHFNFSKNIVEVLVPLLHSKDSVVSNTVCEAFRTVFKEDHLGEITLEAVRAISRFVKGKKFFVNPMVLRAFLHLRIKEIEKKGVKEDPSAGKRKLKHKEKMQVMSRKERRREKQMAALDREMLETAANESKKKKLRFHTQVMESVFVTYFRVLKEAKTSGLLPVVLEGLAKFAHLINIDFFEDLLNVMNTLIESKELKTRELFHCVKTAFSLLSGQGEVIALDPHRFYRHLYTALLKIRPDTPLGDIRLLLACLDGMFARRRKLVSIPRVCAFVKRCVVLAAGMDGPRALGLLAAARDLLTAFPLSKTLLESDTVGSGVYLPDVEDPEHCNAQCASLTELMDLAQAPQFQDTRKLARHMQKGMPDHGDGTLPHTLARNSALVLFDDAVEKEKRATTNGETSGPAAQKKKKQRKPEKTEGDEDFLGDDDEYDEIARDVEEKENNKKKAKKSKKKKTKTAEQAAGDNGKVDVSRKRKLDVGESKAGGDEASGKLQELKRKKKRKQVTAESAGTLVDLTNGESGSVKNAKKKSEGAKGKQQEAAKKNQVTGVDSSPSVMKSKSRAQRKGVAQKGKEKTEDHAVSGSEAKADEKKKRSGKRKKTGAKTETGQTPSKDETSQAAVKGKRSEKSPKKKDVGENKASKEVASKKARTWRKKQYGGPSKSPKSKALKSS